MSKRSIHQPLHSPTSSTYSNNKSLNKRLLKVLTVLLIHGGLFSFVLPLLAQTTPPGTEIRNQATGSYEDPDNMGNVQEVQSNEVVVQVSEVAGITLATSASPAEAPNSINSSNPSQGDGTITADDVVYFTFTLTNVGNDPTQFVIPDSPASINNGTLFGPIELIEYDPDETGTSPVSLNNTTVPQGGGSLTTGTLLNGQTGVNNGSVPAEGTVTIRVPVQVSSTAVDGDQVTVIMGDMPTTGEQNQPLTLGTDDVATQDNPGTDNGDTDGAPANGEREASTSQILSIGGDTDGDGIPDEKEGPGDRDNDGIPDDEDFDPQGYFYDEETGQILSGGSISITPPPGGSVNMIDDGSATGNYQWIASGAAGVYTTVITPPPGYILSPTCNRSDPPAYDPTGNPDPDSLGASEDGSTGRMTSNLCGDNPYYITFDLAPGDPLIINNNYPFIPDPGRDYGDAPDTYGTDAADTGEGEGASHVLVNGLHLGTAPDVEADAQAPLDGTGDGAEDDGITLPPLEEGDTTYTIAATDIAATNTTGTAATLHAWVDFDGSGTFEADEYTSQTVQSGNSSPDGALAWSGAGVSGMTGGTTTYARFRLTTYGLTDDTGTAALDERAVGPVTSGEVEDYAVAIASAPSGPVGNICPAVDLNIPTLNQANANSLITGTAIGGEAITISRVAPANGNPVNFRTSGADANAELVKSVDQSTNWTEGGLTPASVTVPDYIRFDSRDNSANGAAPTYRLQFDFDQAVTNPVVSFSGTANRRIVASTSASLVSSELILDGSSGGNGGTLPVPTATAITNGVELTGAHGSDRFNVSLQVSGTVTSFTVDLTPTTDTLSWTNASGAGIWSQIDNMGVTVATADNCNPPSEDYGDAPDSYGTTAASDGARHSNNNSGMRLGTGKDYENDAVAPLDGTGDGADDDGIDIASLAPLTEGDTTYTIPASAITVQWTQGARITAWIDFDNSGTFDSNESANVSTANNAADGPLVFNGGFTTGAAGETYARFRIAETLLGPTGSYFDGEVEDYRIEIVGSAATTDFGDAPDSYGTDAVDSSGEGIGPSHGDRTILKLGTTIDYENDADIPLDGTGDGADEDGIDLTLLPPLISGATTYTIPASAITAESAGGGRINAWIDFDRSGTFEHRNAAGDNEYARVNVFDGVVQGDLVFNGSFTAGAPGDTYARFRIAEGTFSPFGPSNDGEVEDYKIEIQPAAIDPNVVLVKRITAINGNRTQNPNDNTPLNTTIDDGTANSPDDEANWPANYLLGAINAGTVNPGDEIEYTVYYLNSGELEAEEVRICDWIQPNQSVVTGLYGGDDIELQTGEGAGSTTYTLSTDNDAADRAQLATVDALPAGPTCNLPAASSGTTDDVLVVDLTGTTGDPAGLTTTLPGSTAPGTPDESVGFIRFTTQVDE